MIPYGRKTDEIGKSLAEEFEGSVIPYGRKTFDGAFILSYLFEGSVIPYGRKTGVDYVS